MQLGCFGMKSSIRRHGSGLLLLGLLAVPVFGESVLAKANRTPITPEQEQALIQGHRSWSKTSYSKRRMRWIARWLVSTPLSRYTT